MNNYKLLCAQEEDIYTMGMYPLCGAMCEALGIPETINQALGPLDPRTQLEYGVVAKAMIINILDNRTPLYRFSQAFEGVDCEVLFGKGVYANLFTEARLGDLLDLVSELDHRSLFSALSIRNLNLYGIPVHSSHIDMSNMSVTGEYETYDAEDFSVTFGKAKDKRNDRKLVAFGSAVQQDGLPILGEGLSGNKSDAVWFREAMDEMSQFATGDLHTNPLLIMDAAGSNVETFDLSYEYKMPAIIRLSKVFNITGEAITRACDAAIWREVGTVAEHNTEQAAKYKIYSEEAELGDNPWRLLVIHSSALEHKKEKTAQRNLKKGQEALHKKAERLKKKKFDTPQKAREAAEKLLDGRSEMQRFFECQIEIKPETIERNERPGRPTPDTKKIQITTYHAHVTVGRLDEEQYARWLHYNSCFVLVCNAPQERLSDEEVLAEYKKQWKIENLFSFIKIPHVLEPICLKRPNRIKGLIFILLLAVMVASYLRHRMYQSLQRISEKNITDDSSEDPEEIETDDVEEKSLYEEVIDEAVSGCVLAPGGRLIEHPTFNVMCQLFEDIQIKLYWENGEYIRRFPYRTRRRTFEYIVYTGFHPKIFLEPFRPAFDLWSYREKAPT